MTVIDDHVLQDLDEAYRQVTRRGGQRGPPHGQTGLLGREREQARLAQRLLDIRAGRMKAFWFNARTDDREAIITVAEYVSVTDHESKLLASQTGDHGALRAGRWRCRRCDLAGRATWATRVERCDPGEPEILVSGGPSPAGAGGRRAVSARSAERDRLAAALLADRRHPNGCLAEERCD